VAIRGGHGGDVADANARECHLRRRANHSVETGVRAPVLEASRCRSVERSWCWHYDQSDLPVTGDARAAEGAPPSIPLVLTVEDDEHHEQGKSDSPPRCMDLRLPTVTPPVPITAPRRLRPDGDPMPSPRRHRPAGHR
jgi:hypothetical protein